MNLLFEADNAIPLLHAQVALRVGGSSEPEGKEGTTRLLVRLLRRTAGGRSPDENQGRLDAMGASAHGEVHRTHSALGGTAISRSTSGLLGFLREALLSPHLGAKELEKIRREALAEAVEALDDDSSLARRFFSRGFFGDHPLGKPPQGSRASLQAITLQDVLARYEVLRASEMVLSFAGDADAAELDAFGAGLLGHSASKPSREPDEFSEAAGPAGKNLLFVDKPDRSQTQILMGCMGTRPQDPDHIALYLGHLVFGGTFTARLSQEVRAKRGWSYGAYSSLPIGKNRQPFSLWTFPAKEHTADCIKLCLTLLDNFITRGVTKKELSSVKRHVQNSHAFSVDTASKRVGQALDETLYDLPAGYHQTFVEKVKQTTVDEVNAALRNRLQLDHFLTTVVGTAEGLLDEVAQACGADHVVRVAYDAEL